MKIRGRDAVQAVFIGEFTAVEQAGGGKLVNTSVGGKSFSFALPSGLNTDSLMVACDKALQLWDSLDAEQRAALFTTRRPRSMRVVF